LLLLSDVDGTLIGDDGALPCSPDALRARVREVSKLWPAPFYVGLASSRTLRELTVLQRALRISGPCIAEDGARHAVDHDVQISTSVASGPRVAQERHGRRVLNTFEHAATAQALRASLQHEPAFTRADTQWLPMSALRVLGFRTRAAVRRSLAARTHSVLLDPQVWSPRDLDELRDAAASRGLHMRRGGRWFTLTASGGKGPALRALRHQFTDDGVRPIVAAIGNEENDVSLLAEADCRFVIRNPHRGPHPMLSALPGAVVLDAEGAGGWIEMLHRLVPCAEAFLERNRSW